MPTFVWEHFVFDGRVRCCLRAGRSWPGSLRAMVVNHGSLGVSACRQRGKAPATSFPTASQSCLSFQIFSKQMGWLTTPRSPNVSGHASRPVDQQSAKTATRAGRLGSCFADSTKARHRRGKPTDEDRQNHRRHSLSIVFGSRGCGPRAENLSPSAMRKAANTQIRWGTLYHLGTQT